MELKGSCIMEGSRHVTVPAGALDAKEELLRAILSAKGKKGGRLESILVLDMDVNQMVTKVEVVFDDRRRARISIERQNGVRVCFLAA